MPEAMTFEPDPQQAEVLQHARGPLLVTGGPGTGKTTVVRERFARLIEAGQDPERVALVVRSKQARAAARLALLERLSRPLPGIRVLTVHGLANHVMTNGYAGLGYDRPPDILSALDQFTRVHDLLGGEEPSEWPVFGGMLGLRGFADEVRQFLLRAQEALISPEDIAALAGAAGLAGWQEVAAFYRRYLDVLADQSVVDFSGLVNQAAQAARGGPRLLDHIVVDDFQEATFAEEALLIALAPESLVVAGDEGSHVFSFRGTTDLPLRQFARQQPLAGHVDLATPHRFSGPASQGWVASHTSEEHAAVARELRRIHVEEGIPWGEVAVVVRRQGSHVGGLLRALDDAQVPRSTPGGALSLLAEPAVFPFVLALRWLARPEDRDGLIEPMLASDLAGLSPAIARGLVRAAQAAGGTAATALGRRDGLSDQEAAVVEVLGQVLGEAERVAARSVLDAFAILWRRLPYSRRLVEGGDPRSGGRRDLDAVVAFSEVVARAGDRADSSVAGFLDLTEAGQDAPELSELPGGAAGDAVRVLTAHATAGLEFDTVIVVDAAEGNFPSLSRPEPMFDLRALEGPVSQAARNRFRLDDERRLFKVVASRARRRVLFAAADPHDEPGPLTARSRFVAELGVGWSAAPVGPYPEPLSTREASGAWRRMLADPSLEPAARLAALEGLLALGERPAKWWFQREWTQTGRPLHENIRVSFSRLDTLENCALQYVLSEELGLEGQAGYYAWVGHLVHSIIEDCENGKVERTDHGLLAEADRRWEDEQFPSRAVSTAFRRLVAERMLPAWLESYGSAPALAGEVRFAFDFDGATVSGAIDRVAKVSSGGSQISDYKTGKAKGVKAEGSLQLGIYYLAVGLAPELEPFRPVKQVELVFLREDPGKPWFHATLGMTSKTQEEFGEAMRERLSANIAQIKELNQTEVYRPSPDANCRYCDFKPLCPLWPEGRELFPVPTPNAALSSGSVSVQEGSP
jgi:superfamily I DNA/RNA helicase/RecB family exonuclease